MTLQLQYANGSLVVGAVLNISQTRQAFGFGAALSSYHVANPQYLDFFRSHFNTAVMEGAQKWPATEYTQGQFTYQTADQLIAFCQANNINLRGHTVFWPFASFVPPFVLSKFPPWFYVDTLPLYPAEKLLHLFVHSLRKAAQSPLMPQRCRATGPPKACRRPWCGASTHWVGIHVRVPCLYHS